MDYIKKEIFNKNSSNIYYSNNVIYKVKNEYDIFPYPGWFKSDVKSHKPSVAEREAGWIPKRSQTKIQKYKDKEPSVCFQSACSVVYPCYVQDNSYIYLNKVCYESNQ